jgi:hypothetical protein
MSTLYLEYWTEGDDFCIAAWDEEEFEEELTLEGQSSVLLNHIATLYNILEEKQTERLQEFDKSLGYLSERLLQPFAKQIDTHSFIRFIVFEDLIHAPLDLLLHRGQYLFLQRTVCYQIDEGLVDDEPEVEIGSALLLADLSADPERACAQVAERIDGSVYAEQEDARVELLEEYSADVDLIVISAHGTLTDENEGFITLNDENISTEQLESFSTWLVYFDSCQQGINIDYLATFQYESDVEYYLAPIISNDAGDSSTKTMLWFTDKLMASQNPFQALFETRQSLFNYYTNEEQLDPITVLNKAFAFRLYEFVVEYAEDYDEEEDEE